MEKKGRKGIKVVTYDCRKILPKNFRVKKWFTVMWVRKEYYVRNGGEGKKKERMVMNEFDVKNFLILKFLDFVIFKVLDFVIFKVLFCVCTARVLRDPRIPAWVRAGGYKKNPVGFFSCGICSGCDLLEINLFCFAWVE